MINKNSILYISLLFLYGFLLHSNYYVVSFFVFLVIITLIIVKPKYGFILFLITVVVSPDLVVIKTYTGEEIINHSIFLDSFGGLTFITMTSIFILFISFIRNPNIEINKFVFFLIFVPLMIPLYGFLTTSNLGEYVSSSSYIIVLIAMFLFIKSVDIKQETIIDVLYKSIIVTMLINIIITFYSGFTLIFWGSMAYAFPIILLMKYKTRSFLMDIFLISLLLTNLMIFPSRGRIIVFLIVLSIYFIIKLSKKNLIKVVISLLVIILILIPTYKFIIPAEILSYAEWKLSTFDASDEENQSASIRLIEFKNIILGSIDKIYPIFIGEGYGGYFVDKYAPFYIPDLLDANAFKNEWIYDRTFYRPHTVLNILLLKAGIIPTVIFFSGLFYLTIYYMKKVSRFDSANLFIIVLPFLAVVMYTQKLQIIFAICLYILNESLINYHRVKDNNEYQKKSVGNIDKLG
ncbi:hypothetical protein ATL39_0525 [Sinobaca qinghaiensis]|uniref:O-antigen ligase-like membrane protein n=1 Tax=Sinobaca qinghaiensis TaxID=342944 RepID=A0A419V8F0_9BACL|nr:hypothetical protein [Sinobaca qinghaiensis]RKD76310.1 hypothetical protein ATL39_0525 [Sinobaca qinghaiensis]